MDDYPVDVVAEYPERTSRLLALVALLGGVIKLLLLLPHLIVLSILGFVAGIAAVIGWIAVLFLGSYPRALFDFQVGTPALESSGERLFPERDRPLPAVPIGSLNRAPAFLRIPIR